MVLAILGIALPPLVSAFAEASMQSIRPIRSAQASFLAIERMEEVVARRYRGTDGYAALSVPTAGDFPDESPVGGFASYERTVRVNYVDGDLADVGSDQGYKKASVTVSWDGGDERVVIERIFADFN